MQLFFLRKLGIGLLTAAAVLGAAPPASQPTVPPCTVAGDSAHRATATGFFHLAQIDGRWWFCTPSGDRFFAIGVDHVNYNWFPCEKLGYAPYHRVVQQLYGSERAWGDAELRRLTSWGFNSLTANYTPSLRYRGLAHTEFLGWGANYAARDAIFPRTNWTGFPNVFDPGFADYCDHEAKRRCAAERDDPWLVGYFIDNELQWFGAALSTHLRDYALKLPPDNPAHEIAASATADEFDRLVAEKYFSITTAAIRRYDPNHVVLGCRFAGRAPEVVWPVAGKYCDVVSVNVYPMIDLLGGEADDVETLLRTLHQAAGRPFMITEWSFSALDAVDSAGRPLNCSNGSGMRLDTQEQRARCCQILQSVFFRLPFVVGSDFFMWVDEPALGISIKFPQNTNYGLVSEADKPYAPLVDMFTQLNAQVYRIHAAAPAVSLAPAPPPIPSSAPASPLAGAVRIERHADRINVDNGVLRLIKDQPDGEAWNRIEYRGHNLGRFTPMIWQKLPQDSWLCPARVVVITASENKPATVIDMTFDAPGAYRVVYRFTIYPNQNWFLSQFRSIESTADKPWTLMAYCQTLHGAPRARITSPGVSEYYIPFGAWLDTAANLQVGVMAVHPTDFHVQFSIDEHGGQHPDARRQIEKPLTSGARFDAPQPPIIIFAAPAGVRPLALLQNVRAILSNQNLEKDGGLR